MAAEERVIQEFPSRCPYCDACIDYGKFDLKAGENPIRCPSCKRVYIKIVPGASGPGSFGPAARQADDLLRPVQYVKGVGPKLAALLEKKEVRTIEDALYFLPRAYEDRRNLKKISELGTEGKETSFGEILAAGSLSFRGRERIFEITAGDGSGLIALKWFHGDQRFLRDRFKKGRSLIFSGEVKIFRGRKEMVHPDVEIVEGEGNPAKDYVHFKRIVPIYSETEGLYQKTLRRVMKNVVDGYAGKLRSPLPPEIVERQGLIGCQEAFRSVHFPPEDASVEALNLFRSEGHRRIVFEEFFFLELGLALKKRGTLLENGIPMKRQGPLAERLLGLLPFRLTPSQEKTCTEVGEDLERPHPMHRLIQGDVGSGKTVVALLACVRAVESGCQAAIMAPTEVLAEQHYLTLSRWVEPLGVRIALLTSRVKGPEKQDLYERVRRGEVHLLVGTHAVIQEGVEFQRLGLAVVDEQHKFGVLQRGLLKKKGENPHLLIMTATPIPRTLAMTVYGDLDVSVIRELPPGRRPVETRAFPESARQRVYRLLEEEVQRGRQAFIVYPLVEESEKLELKAAVRMAEHFRREVFPHLRVGLLHGRMSGEEKREVMEAFKRGETHLLVATTVIEVGIDIPNASVMVIEHAERFGLSQLHQLRGRIGRGLHPSKCLLLHAWGVSEEARKRLLAMERTSDGFQIAEEDLRLRGPGDFFGVQQSGFPDLRVGHLVRDAAVLAEARREAFRLVREDPELTRPFHQDLRETLRRKWAGRLELAKIG